MTRQGRPRSVPDYPVRVCEVCGGDFKPNRRAQKHCKSTCSLELGRKKRSEMWSTYTRRMSYLGYWEIKVDGEWRVESRWRYEQYHNLRLPRSAYVGFRDGNHENMSKENLYLKNPELDRAVQETGKLPKLVNGKPPKIKRSGTLRGRRKIPAAPVVEQQAN